MKPSPLTTAPLKPIERARVTVRGAVQGVGFRPFVYRLARELALRGWVCNSSQGLVVEVEGAPDLLRSFVHRLETEKPPRAIVQNLEVAFLDAAGHDGFTIRQSDESGAKTAYILPDTATCPDCVREIFDPANRRYRYPFTNCTNCGPRFSIIEVLPYDRPATSMRGFAMCPECEREYHDPLDRRFHAQPNACPRCGPQLELWTVDGQVQARLYQALLAAAEVIRAGKILALKGIGGFQLVVDARDPTAVAMLRERKRREEKPFALMFPSLETACSHCRILEREERLLLSPEAPIVLLAKRRDTPAPAIAPNVAPGNASLGVMLPYTPLHYLLLNELGFPVVATSGNLSDEPICIDNEEAIERLQNIADCFLLHDRPIVRHVDDSIVRVVCGREMLLRRARGYAPLPVHSKEPLPTVLAMGAHLKNSVALSVGSEIFISQHIGDLETAQAHAAFRKAAADLPRLYEATPETIACDLHPDYLSTRHAAQVCEASAFPITLCPVQHHFAHVLACMADNALKPPVLGVAWDGTGYGIDSTIWGGEFLVPTANSAAFQRVGHLRQFGLPGGEAAIKRPARSALGLLFEIFGESLWGQTELVAKFPPTELTPLRQMLARKFNVPLTSSAGRLFDAAAALLGLRERVSFEGQAAIALEAAIKPGIALSYNFTIRGGSPHVIDWQEAILEMMQDVQQRQPLGVIAAKFHNTLAEMILGLARKIGEQKIVLTGGCFQNKYLLEETARRLAGGGFVAYWHRQVPPNDGGIALGQIAAAAAAIRAHQLSNHVFGNPR